MLDPQEVVDLLNEVALLNLAFAGTLLLIGLTVNRSNYVFCWMLVFVSSTVNAVINNHSDWFAHANFYWSWVNLTSIITMALTVTAWRMRESKPPISMPLLALSRQFVSRMPPAQGDETGT